MTSPGQTVRPLNVLLSSYALSPVRGSEPGNSWRLAEGLAIAGHRVTVLTTRLYADEHTPSDHLSANLSFEYVDAPLPRLLNRGQLGVYARYLAWQRKSLRRARALVEAAPDSFDVVHHYSWGSLFWGTPLTRLGLPSVFGPVGGGSTSPRELRPS